MNNLISYFNDNIRGKSLSDSDTKEKITVFESMIDEADLDTVLEASKVIALFTFGASKLKDRISNTSLPHDTVLEQITNLTDIGVHMQSNGYKNIDHMQAIHECVNTLKTYDVVMSSSDYVYEKAKAQFTKNLRDLDNKIVLEGTFIQMDEAAVMETMKVRTQAEFDLAFAEAFLGPEENFTMESMMDLVKLSNRYDEIINDEIALEASATGQSKVRKAALKVDNASRKTANAIRNKSKDAAAVATTAKKASGQFTGLVSSTLGKLNKMQKEERLEAVLQGGMRRRLSTLIRTAIMSGAAFAVHPALGAITLLTSATLHNRSDARLKREMVQEYQGEIKLVQEKIRDAESAGDRAKKYELMRIENHLENSIERINSPLRLNKPRLRKG